MSFAAPLFLIAALAGIIPVVLHMVNRQRAKELPFSTLRFLRISVQKTRRRKRVHDVLLMLIRTLLLLLIAFGLAKPALRSLGSLLGGGATSAVAIILDNSASMGTIDRGRMRFKTALGAAEQIMAQLRDGDQVALFLTGGPQSPEQGVLDRTHATVRQMLDQYINAASEDSGVSYERADLTMKVQAARKLLGTSEASRKQIFVLTDLQRLSWETQSAQPAQNDQKKQDLQQPDVPIIFVNCSREPQPNVAVTGVELDAPLPVAGMPIKATVELLNASEVEQQRHLELFINGAKRASSPVLKIPAAERLRHEFHFSFQEGGLGRGEVRLVGEDGSVFDDRRFFAMEVDRAIPVAIVKPQTHEIHYLEDTFYVEQALAPTGAIRATIVTAEDLLGEPLSNYKVVYCVNLPALDEDTAGQLRAYVAGGGNLVWTCGNNVEPDAYNRMNENGQLLPAGLLEVRAPAPGEDRDAWHISFLDKQHPALGRLVEPASLYQSVLVYKHLRLDTDGQAGCRVLARLDDGEPLLVQRNVGRGTLTMLGTSCHVGWTNLPLRPIFLPLLTRLTFDLAGVVQARRMLLAGAPLVLPLEDSTRPGIVEVLPPGGETIRLPAKDKQGNRLEEFRYPDTHEIGIYLLRLLESARPVQVAFSVNADPEEANPATIEREELEQRLGRNSLVFAEDPDDLSATFQWLREGTSLWELFLAGVLVLLVFETFLSNRLSPKQEDEQLEKIPPGMRRLARKGRGAA